MLSLDTHWLMGRPKAHLAPHEKRSAIAFFLIFAFCFNILPPNFSFSGTAETSGEGSLFNQVFWLGIFALSLSTVIRSKRPIHGVVFMAAPLIVLCAFLATSSLWSLAPPISFRRSVLQIIVVFSVLALIGSIQDTRQTFLILYRVAAVTLIFEFVMLFRANGFDEAGLFRGIHTQKNVLGLLCGISILTGVWVRGSGLNVSKNWNSLFLLSWFGLLLLAQSKTSLGLIIIAPAVALGFSGLARRTGVGVGAIILIIVALIYSVCAIAFIGGVDVAGAIADWVHHVGFTGRDSIWDFLIARFLERPWMGHGYGGFWDIGLNAPNVRYGTGFITQINQAHNGYLDLLLSAGLAGLVLYVVVLIGYFYCFSQATLHKTPTALQLCWVLFIFSVLHNFTESTLLRGYSPVWVMQLVALATTYRLAFEAKPLR